MSIVEDPKPPFDASKFVTYQTEELTTPTEKELLEDLPEWEGREAHRKKVEEKESKPRRGVGFLRAEPATESTDGQSDEAADSDFGAGLDEAELKAISEKNPKRPPANRSRRDRPGRKPQAKPTKQDGPADGNSANQEHEAGGEKTPGRKRRRRRGRRNRKDSPQATGDSTVTSQDSADGSNGTKDIASASALSGPGDKNSNDGDGGQSGPPTGEKRKPRRRRRRGGRNRGNSGSGDGASPGPSPSPPPPSE